MDIGKSTKIALAQRGKDPKWLANKLQVTRQRVNDITNNPNSSTATIEKLCEVFDIAASDFIALGEVEF